MEGTNMIELTQRDSINDFDNGNKIDTTDIIKLHISSEMLDREMSRIEKMGSVIKSDYDKKNISILTKYLNNIKKKMDENNDIEICWTPDGTMAKTYPISIINERAYNFDTCNIIEIGDRQKIVEVNLTDLADIIAFEFMYRDLYETHDSIEELLKNCGIIGYEDSSILTNLFKENGDNVYELSKSMKIWDTPYYSYEDKTIIDYFHMKKFKKDTYKDVVEYSCKYAAFIILNKFIKNAMHVKMDIKPIMLTPTHIAFMLNDVDDNIDISTIIEDVSIRVFGRKFVIKPNVTVL